MPRALLFVLALALLGCPSEPEPYVASWPTLVCDDLAEAYCGFPFPNNVFTEAADTPTGLRVALSPDALPNTGTGAYDPTAWNRGDGFSPGGPIFVHLPGATEAGLNDSTDIGASLEAGALSVVLNLETGEAVPHWAELDRTTDVDSQRTLLLQPAVRLEDATRYVVAFRGLSTALGQALPPTSMMEQILAGNGPADRQPLYDEELLPALEAAGWGRDEIQIAWDFTTASRASTTGWLLQMRDVALAEVADGGPAFTIDSVEDDWNPDHIAFRIHGTMQAPRFLTGSEAGATLVFGADGLPELNGTMDVPFEVLIPNSALAEPKALLQYGHGLFGELDQIESEHFRNWIDEYGWVFFAADLKGMASDDEDWVRGVLLSGELDRMAAMYDRLHQGFVNWILLMELMQTGMAEHPDFGAYIDPREAQYHGISQGGIMGLVYAAASPHIDRAALGVMGQPYALLLSRSVDFEEFFLALKLVLDDPRDIQLMLGLAQMLWDRVEPSGWSAYVEDDKQIFLRDAIGDHQVTTLGAHVMARTLGAAHVDTGIRDVWGLEAVAGTTSGHTLVEYDFGLPTVPTCNVPMSLCGGPHGELRKLDPALQQLDLFLRTGEVRNFCDGGNCSFPDLSECEVNEDDEAAQALCGANR
ncbi:MAG: hypothetical protein GY898_08595 [Proteobacteria bacterium]|nr:hypothetical protein [Pseudomonadota bacterium]